MGDILMHEHPSIVWTPCAAHCIDLLIHDMCVLPWIREITTQAMRVVNFVTRKKRILGLFRNFSSLDLKRPAPTHFGYYFVVIERLLVVRDHLRKMVASDGFDEFRGRGEDAVHFQRTVLGDEFWTWVEELVEALQPVFYVLRLVDRQGCTLGLIYEFMDRIEEVLSRSTLNEARRQELLSIWKQRWHDFRKPIHAVAHMLHPLWRSTRQQRGDVKLHQGWVEYLERVCPGPGPILKNIERDFLKFEQSMWPFSRQQCQFREDQLCPVTWWACYGRITPDLRRLAERVLSQDCSASACERNWSTWSTRRTAKSNMLSIDQCRQLGFVANNGRMLRRLGKERGLMEVNPDSCMADSEATLPQERPTQEEADDEVFRELHTQMGTEACAVRRHRRAAGRRERWGRVEDGDDELSGGEYMVEE